MKESIKDKLNMVDEAIKDWKKGKLPDLSALVAIQLCVNEQKISKELIEWATSNIKKEKK